MQSVLTDLRRAIEVERVQQAQRAREQDERIETLQRQIEALKCALAQRAETAEHPIAALTLDVSSLAGVNLGATPPRALLDAVCGVRLVDANRAALRVFKMTDCDELMDRAGEVFRADLIEPLVRFSRALAHDQNEFRCAARLHDGVGEALSVELRASITRPVLGSSGFETLRHVTFAVIDQPRAAAPAAPVLRLAAKPAEDAAHQLPRQAA
ncbi:MAG: hypothetical protein PVI23_01865 [Maricaulaceae bacterium]|jgi:hypothetical protein